MNAFICNRISGLKTTAVFLLCCEVVKGEMFCYPLHASRAYEGRKAQLLSSEMTTTHKLLYTTFYLKRHFPIL